MNTYPAALSIIMILVVLVIALAVTAVMIFLWWRVFSKAGYSGALGLLTLVPFGCLIMLCILAFSRWPILKGSDSAET